MTDLPAAAPALPPFPSLDDLLAQEDAKVSAWDDVHTGRGMSPNGVAAWGLEQRAQAFGEHEERLGYLLAALGELVGPAVLLEIREQVAGMLDTGRALHQAAVDSEGQAIAARADRLDLMRERDRARRTADLLESNVARARDLVEASHGPDAAAAAFDAEPTYGSTGEPTTTEES